MKNTEEFQKEAAYHSLNYNVMMQFGKTFSSDYLCFYFSYDVFTKLFSASGKM